MSEMAGSPLARALAKAQGAMAKASKDRVNPHYRSSYATLASVWDACRDPLSANGLAVVQLVAAADKASVTVETRLLHEGGESVSSSLTMPVAQATAQGVGSAITYARRYALAALVGVAPDDDDDGNEASRAPTRAPTPPPSPVKQRRADAEQVERVLLEAAATLQDGFARRIVEAATLEALTAVGLELAREPASVRDAHRAAYTARHAALGRGGAR